MLSRDLMEMMPGVEGFTRKNLQNATRFYRFYSTDENQKQLVSISQDEDDNENRKQLENYRLKELIIEDLKIYKSASITEIQKRIGEEIPSKKIWNQLTLIARG